MKKYYLTYLPPGEFGPKELWGILTDRDPQPSVINWVAFYKTREDALAAFPEAVRI